MPPRGTVPVAGPPPTRGATPLRPTEAELPPDEGPLKLAFASPQGDEVAVPLPTFVFTRAMHRLGDPPGEPLFAASFDPPVEGTWHWVGSRALQFSPAAPSPRPPATASWCRRG